MKNGSSGSADDSELNITPDGQVLQVISMAAPRDARKNICGIRARFMFIKYSFEHTVIKYKVN